MGETARIIVWHFVRKSLRGVCLFFSMTLFAFPSVQALDEVTLTQDFLRLIELENFYDLSKIEIVAEFREDKNPSRIKIAFDEVLSLRLRLSLKRKSSDQELHALEANLLRQRMSFPIHLRMKNGVFSLRSKQDFMLQSLAPFPTFQSVYNREARAEILDWDASDTIRGQIMMEAAEGGEDESFHSLELNLVRYLREGESYSLPELMRMEARVFLRVHAKNQGLPMGAGIATPLIEVSDSEGRERTRLTVQVLPEPFEQGHTEPYRTRFMDEFQFQTLAVDVAKGKVHFFQDGESVIITSYRVINGDTFTRMEEIPLSELEEIYTPSQLRQLLPSYRKTRSKDDV